MIWRENFKKYFIPSEQNEHQPYFLREWSVFGLLMLIILLEGAAVIPSFFILPHSESLIAVLPEVLTDAINRDREQAGLLALAPDPALAAAARERAEKFAAAGGGNFDADPGWSASRLGTLVGEYVGVNFFDTEDLITAWRRAETARGGAALEFRTIGIGVAPGRYQGRATLYAVARLSPPSISAEPTDPYLQPNLNRALEAARGVTRIGFWQRLGTKLHALVSQIYLILLGITLIAFVLNFVTKIHIQHPPIIVNGLLLITMLIVALYLNEQLFASRIMATYTERALSTSVISAENR